MAKFMNAILIKPYKTLQICKIFAFKINHKNWKFWRLLGTTCRIDAEILYTSKFTGSSLSLKVSAKKGTLSWSYEFPNVDTLKKITLYVNMAHTVTMNDIKAIDANDEQVEHLPTLEMSFLNYSKYSMFSI
jgi:hypothetical protein